MPRAKAPPISDGRSLSPCPALPPRPASAGFVALAALRRLSRRLRLDIVHLIPPLPAEASGTGPEAGHRHVVAPNGAGGLNPAAPSPRPTPRPQPPEGRRRPPATPPAGARAGRS